MLIRHLQCKLAEDYLMMGSVDLGQRRAGRAERRSGSSAGPRTPADSSCLGRNGSLGQGLATERSEFARRAESLVTLGLLAGSVWQTARFKMHY